MTFPGANLVTVGPRAFEATGTSKYWYWMDPIRDAVANTTNKNVSGYKFEPVPDIDFSKNGNFAFLEGVVISGYPTIEIKVKSANYKKIQQDFSQSSEVGVSAFGVEFVSASEKTSSSKVSVDEANKTVTITISPPPTLVAGTVNDARGWVLGVLPVYPAA